MVLFSPYMSSMKIFLLVTWEYVYIEINRGKTSKSFIEPKSMSGKNLSSDLGLGLCT